MKNKNKYDLINFGYNPWSRFWKRNQTIFYLLAKQPYVENSYYINNQVWLADFIQSPLKQICQPIINNWKYIMPVNTHGSRIYTPFRLPFLNKIPFLRFINDRIINFFTRRDIDYQSIVIVNNFSNEMRYLIDPMWKKASIKIFDWSDDFEYFSTNNSEKKCIAEQVEYYIKTADLVLTINDKLTEKAKLLNPSSVTLRNATNFFTFKKDATPYIKNKIKSMTRPVIGYVGWINSLRLDEGLITYIALSRPNWNFVFVGPKVDAHDSFYKQLSKLSNIHILDPVEYNKLYSIYDCFDVCIIPNQINKHTDGNDPIKIYDYLATGKPVVSTATSGTEAVKDFIYIAKNKNEFIEHIEQALSEDGKVSPTRIKKAYENSWEVRVKSLVTYLEAHIEKVGE